MMKRDTHRESVYESEPSDRLCRTTYLCLSLSLFFLNINPRQASKQAKSRGKTSQDARQQGRDEGRKTEEGSQDNKRAPCCFVHLCPMFIGSDFSASFSFSFCFSPSLIPPRFTLLVCACSNKAHGCNAKLLAVVSLQFPLSDYCSLSFSAYDSLVVSNWLLRMRPSHCQRDSVSIRTLTGEGDKDRECCSRGENEHQGVHNTHKHGLVRLLDRSDKEDFKRQRDRGEQTGGEKNRGRNREGQRVAERKILDTDIERHVHLDNKEQRTRAKKRK